jgi:hypothetical protein
MRIEPVEKDRAPARVRRIYDAIERQGRPVTNMLKVLAVPKSGSSEVGSGVAVRCRCHRRSTT